MNWKSRNVTQGIQFISRGIIHTNVEIERGATTMELMEVIISRENLNKAYKKVVSNKGTSGIDGVTVDELGLYIKVHREEIVRQLKTKTYFPKPVRRVYIPKSNGKQRPLGIPAALDRVIQQAIAQPLSEIYEGV